MNKPKKPPAATEADFQNIHIDNSEPIKRNLQTSSEAQRARLLEAFKAGRSLTTLDCRGELNVMHPAGRVKELRTDGHDIRTTMKRDDDADGRPHCVGLYSYHGQRHGAGGVK